MKRGVYIVILNWNGWRDTLRCLESVLDSELVRPKLIVCDNGSTDGSIDQLVAWSKGRRPAPRLAGSPLADRVPVRRVPRVFQELERSDVDAGCAAPHRAEVALIHNRENLGFAGGCNVGLRYALAQPDMTHVWLLNNDTLVEPDCLRRMLRRLDEAGSRALCGSMILTAEEPDRVNACGGNRINGLTGIASAGLGRGRRVDELDVTALERQLDYLSGASALLPRAFLEEVGLMDERYFLYYEEIDWMIRARGRWELVVAGDAILYHHEGASIGTGTHGRRATPRAELFQLRARLLFLRAHWPGKLLFGYGAAWLQVLNRLRRWELANAAALARLLLGGYRTHPKQWPAG